MYRQLLITSVRLGTSDGRDGTSPTCPPTNPASISCKLHSSSCKLHSSSPALSTLSFPHLLPTRLRTISSLLVHRFEPLEPSSHLLAHGFNVSRTDRDQHRVEGFIRRLGEDLSLGTCHIFQLSVGRTSTLWLIRGKGNIRYILVDQGRPPLYLLPAIQSPPLQSLHGPLYRSSGSRKRFAACPLA